MVDALLHEPGGVREHQEGQLVLLQLHQETAECVDHLGTHVHHGSAARLLEHQRHLVRLQEEPVRDVELEQFAVEQGLEELLVKHVDDELVEVLPV